MGLAVVNVLSAILGVWDAMGEKDASEKGESLKMFGDDNGACRVLDGDMYVGLSLSDVEPKLGTLL